MHACIIFANGDPNDGAMLRRHLHQTTSQAHVIAADGGARNAAYFGYEVDTLIGDMDSITLDRLEAIRAAGGEVLRYPAEKDETDLELALRLAAERGATWIRVLGALGSRFDQTIANIYLLALPSLEGRDVQLLAGKQAIRVLRPGQHLIEGQRGDTVSLVPLGGDVQGIRTVGLKYPLYDETLHVGPARGISNVLLSAQATLSVQAGLLLVVHTLGRAE